MYPPRGLEISGQHMDGIGQAGECVFKEYPPLLSGGWEDRGGCGHQQ